MPCSARPLAFALALLAPPLAAARAVAAQEPSAPPAAAEQQGAETPRTDAAGTGAQGTGAQGPAGQGTPAPLQRPLALDDLPTLARARSERQRPAQVEALRPFLKDLVLEYGKNKEYLDGRLPDVVALGDGVVPLLLENLSPSGNDADARNVAANSARVLRHLDPGSFVEALAELAQSQNPIAVTQAVGLLGWASGQRAKEILIDLLDDLQGPDLRTAIGSLRRLGGDEAAPRVVAFLRTEDPLLHLEVLQYLAEVRPARVLDQVLPAVAADRAGHDLGLWLRYLTAAAPANATAAETLLPFLGENHVDREQQVAVVEALSTIAPKEHKPTLQALRGILERREIGRLGLAAALTMHHLGDTSGRKELLRQLNEEVRRKPRDPGVLTQRGDFFMAFERWKEAVDDYSDALKRPQSPSAEQMLWLLIARCEAHQGRFSIVEKALKDGRLSRDQILKEAQRDAEFAKALERDHLQRYLKSLSY